MDNTCASGKCAITKVDAHDDQNQRTCTTNYQAGNGDLGWGNDEYGPGGENDFWRKNIPNGTGCTHNWQCSSGYCDENNNTCRAKTGLGQQCSSGENSECASGTCECQGWGTGSCYCVPNSQSAPKIQGVGQCHHSWQCQTAFCNPDTDRCQSKTGLGQQCSSGENSECGSGVCDCRGLGWGSCYCVPPANASKQNKTNNDGQCHENANCKSGVCNTSRDRCDKQVGNGSSCSRDSECKPADGRSSGYCWSGQCYQRCGPIKQDKDGFGCTNYGRNGQPGSACKINDHCTGDDYCWDGKCYDRCTDDRLKSGHGCIAKKSNGSSCTDDYQCTSDNCGRDSSYVYPWATCDWCGFCDCIPCNCRSGGGYYNYGPYTCR